MKLNNEQVVLVKELMDKKCQQCMPVAICSDCKFHTLSLMLDDYKPEPAGTKAGETLSVLIGNESGRCYCCGGEMRSKSLVCSTCYRDAELNTRFGDGKFAAKVDRALTGESQVCLKCGWSNCICKRLGKK